MDFSNTRRVRRTRRDTRKRVLRMAVFLRPALLALRAALLAQAADAPRPL